jgi:hypothetical protein
MSSSIKLSPLSPSSASPPSITTSMPPPTTTQQQNIVSDSSISMNINSVSSQENKRMSSPKITPIPISMNQPAQIFNPEPIQMYTPPPAPTSIPYRRSSSSSSSSSSSESVANLTPINQVSAPTPVMTETIVKSVSIFVKPSNNRNLIITFIISSIVTFLCRQIIISYSPNTGYLMYVYFCLFFIIFFSIIYFLLRMIF